MSVQTVFILTQLAWVCSGLTYEFVPEEKIFNEAEDYCISAYSGHLASISSPSTNVNIGSYCPVGKHCWIGLARTNSEWTWKDGTTYDFVSWASGNPGSALYGAMANDGAWYGEDGNEKLKFICSHG